MKPSNFLASLAGIAAAGMSIAAEKPPSTELSKIDFVTLDKDSSGSLSKEEVKVVSGLTGQFDTLDADHDRALSRTEFTRWNRASAGRAEPRDPTTVPGGSAGAQHMPERD